MAAYFGKILSCLWRDCAVLLAVLCVASAFVHAEKPAQCTPSFPFKQGWWGADAAYSIPLPDGRSVWIFGDTLYGDKRVVVGNAPRMVHNSIGVSQCGAGGKWDLQYVIRHGPDGQPAAFFQAQKKETWYWALDGFVHGRDLWVTLLCVRKAKAPQPWAMDFETCGADLAQVSGLSADPQKWKVKYFPLAQDGVAAYPSATTVVNGAYVYLFALYEKDNRPMFLTRIPLAGLETPPASLQYLSKAGKWEPGLKPEDAMAVMVPGASEMTVRYHADLKKWVAVMKSPDFLSDAIVLRTADRITGPWSEGQVIYRIPEMQTDSPGYQKNTFCYAGKEHPEFEEPGSLLVTYVCNTMKVPDLATKLKIYVPKVLRLSFPKEEQSSRGAASGGDKAQKH